MPKDLSRSFIMSNLFIEMYKMSLSRVANTIYPNKNKINKYVF